MPSTRTRRGAGTARALSVDLSSPALIETGPSGDAARAAAGAAIQQSKAAEFYSLGLVLGYGYGRAEDARAQAPSMDRYLPLARAGNRLPHSRNQAGDSLYDLLGPEFTVIGGNADRWPAAAEERRIPLVWVDPPASGFPSVHAESVVLVRPDQHIAWTGSADDDPSAALALAVRGFPPVLID